MSFLDHSILLPSLWHGEALTSTHFPFFKFDKGRRRKFYRSRHPRAPTSQGCPQAGQVGSASIKCAAQPALLFLSSPSLQTIFSRHFQPFGIQHKSFFLSVPSHYRSLTHSRRRSPAPLAVSMRFPLSALFALGLALPAFISAQLHGEPHESELGERAHHGLPKEALQVSFMNFAPGCPHATFCLPFYVSLALLQINSIYFGVLPDWSRGMLTCTPENEEILATDDTDVPLHLQRPPIRSTPALTSTSLSSVTTYT